METEDMGTEKTQTHDEARKLLDDAWSAAGKAFKEAKTQADIIYGEAKKAAVDKDARKRADEAHKQAIEDAKQVRDAITNVALATFTEFWKKQKQDVDDAAANKKERGIQAEKAYKEAKKQADADRKLARDKAVDSSARDEANAAHKTAGKQAKKDYEDAMNS